MGEGSHRRDRYGEQGVPAPVQVRAVALEDERVAATLGAVALGGALTVSLFGVAASDVLVDAYHAFRGDPFYTETQTPDGTVYQAHIQAVPGHPHRYRLLYRAKLHPGEAPGADLQVDAEPPKG